MKPINVDPLLQKMRRRVDDFNLGQPGQYCRWIIGPRRNLTLNPTGTADAANILYTLGDFPAKPEERKAWIDTLQGMQDPETGLYHDTPLHPMHTTAFCTAALQLFDAHPLYPCYSTEAYETREGLYHLLEQEIDWENPWGEAHKGAGLLAILENTERTTYEWKQWYFDWLWEHSDPESGFFYFNRGCERTATEFQLMAGGFHYMFNYEYEHRPYRYPEKIIDTCLHLYAAGESRLIRQFDYPDIDEIYSLNRAMRQTTHRREEAVSMLEEFAERWIAMANDLDVETHLAYGDIHYLFAGVCTIAELQAALPGKILSSHPLHLVLDRRPFI